MLDDLKKRFTEETKAGELNIVIHLVMGSICAGLVGLIVYAQIVGCSTGCGG